MFACDMVDGDKNAGQINVGVHKKHFAFIPTSTLRLLLQITNTSKNGDFASIK